jgi:hypothetical protein
VTGAVCWLASYPKSGNTWLRAVHAAAVTRADIDINRLPSALAPATRALLDDALGLSTSDLTVAEVEALRPRVDELLAGSLDRPVLRKVHDAYLPGAGGEPVVSVAAARGVLYLLRDPRDVAVSLVGHTGLPIDAVVGLMANPAAVLAAARDGLDRYVEQRIGSWSGHVRSWVAQRQAPVRVLRYEDAAADPVGAFGPALRFAGLELTDAEVAVAVERASFRVLAGQEARSGFGERLRPEARFFRRGQIGAWRDELPPALAARLVRDHREVMGEYRYL